MHLAELARSRLKLSLQRWRLDCADEFSQLMYQHSCHHVKLMKSYSLWVMHHRDLANENWLQRIRYLSEPDHCLDICRHRTSSKQDLFLNRPEMIDFIHRIDVFIRWRYHDTCESILRRWTADSCRREVARPRHCMKTESSFSYQVSLSQ